MAVVERCFGEMINGSCKPGRKHAGQAIFHPGHFESRKFDLTRGHEPLLVENYFPWQDREGP